MAFKKTTKFTSKKTTTKSSTKRKGAGARLKGPAFKRAVKQVLRGAAEKKVSNLPNLSHSIVPAVQAVGATFDGQIVQVSPGATAWSIAQGPSQDERIGNRIRIQRATLKGTMVPEPYDATENPNPQPIVVQMILFYDKTLSTGFPTPCQSDDLFQLGSTVDGFRNDLVDTWAPINTDKYVVMYRRQFKLGFANYAGTGTQAAWQSYSNNDFKLNQKFSINLTPYLVKNVRYNDNNVDPMTRGLWCAWQAIASDGTAMNGARIPARCQYSLDLTYTDV